LRSCFFFSSRRRHTRYIGDWSSDVCSSDLNDEPPSTNPSSSDFVLHLDCLCIIPPEHRFDGMDAMGNSCCNALFFPSCSTLPSPTTRIFCLTQMLITGDARRKLVSINVTYNLRLWQLPKLLQSEYTMLRIQMIAMVTLC